MVILNTRHKLLAVGGVMALAAGLSVAQMFGGRGFGRGRGGFGGFGGGYRGMGSPDEPLISTEGGDTVNEETVRTAREIATHSAGADTPVWSNSPGFEKDVFTFTRIIYNWTSSNPQMSRFPGMTRWINDFPDCDLDISYRLHQMTSLRVDPDGRVIKLTSPELLSYPFIYMEKPAGLELKDEDVAILRKYLLNGGALMADDIWGDTQWESFAAQIKRVLPERNWTELKMDHPVFHSVFDLKAKEVEELQVPPIQRWARGVNTGLYGGYGSFRGDGDPDMHVRAWLDDKGRIMVICTHNTDDGDGWEREGEDVEYFKTFSEPRAYPLGINIIYYLMTH